MKTKFFATFLGLAFLMPTLVHADTILFEDFEDSTITYTGPMDAVGDLLLGGKDYYGRITPALQNSATDFFNTQGFAYYGVEDSDGASGGSGALDPVVLNWSSITVASFENLQLSWFVAEDDDGSNQDWDPDSSFLIEVNLDGAGFQTVFRVEAEDDVFSNSVPRVDTNNDGIGDGAEITDTFAQFSTLLPNASSVDIRVTFDGLTANDEDFAFDNLRLEGDLTGVPEPGAALLLSTALIGCFLRRRRA